MTFPFVIDNSDHRLGNVLNKLLSQTEGRPFDVATAYFAVSGYRLVKDSLHQVGAFRLLLGAEPQSGTDVGLRPNAAAIKARLQGDLEAEPFTEATLRLVDTRMATSSSIKLTGILSLGALHPGETSPYGNGQFVDTTLV
jgi:hypothetical protein